MKTSTLSHRLALFLLLVLPTFESGAAAGELSQAAPGQASVGPSEGWGAEGRRAGGMNLHANKLFDYIRGNRSRMVQVATIGLGIGLVILMTATRKN